jgi:DNA-binding transcriptional regulator LsrR (DeoR family)
MEPDEKTATSSRAFLQLDREKHQLLADVATLYYKQNLTQAEIADSVGVSRASISRLLREARDVGVVEITINEPVQHAESYSDALRQAFHLEEAHVIGAGARGYTQTVEALGAVAARILRNKLRDKMVLGISWNTGVYQVVRALQEARSMDVTVVQLTGTAGSSNPLLDGPDLARWLADTLGGRYLYLPAPLVVPSEDVQRALLADRTIAERLEMAKEADVALVGIGTVAPPLNSLLQTGYITEEELAAITRQGAVGDILNHFYDANGQILDLPLHNRLIGLHPSELRGMKSVVGVAAGDVKAEAIIGALRGGYITCLVTDDRAARAILNIIPSMN